MINLREAAQQALDALNTVVVDVKTTPTAYETHRQAITALETALAAPQPEPKPVGFMWRHIQTGCTTVLLPNFYSDTGGSGLCVGPLYTHPPQRQPLTDEEINAHGALAVADDGSLTVRDFVRAIEKAHGIGGDK